MDKNDIYVRLRIKSVFIGDCCKFKDTSQLKDAKIRSATILKIPRKTCLLPGSSINLPVPSDYQGDFISVEPRSEKDNWLKCSIKKSEEGTIAVKNDSDLQVLSVMIMSAKYAIPPKNQIYSSL